LNISNPVNNKTTTQFEDIKSFGSTHKTFKTVTIIALTILFPIGIPVGIVFAFIWGARKIVKLVRSPQAELVAKPVTSVVTPKPIVLPVTPLKTTVAQPESSTLSTIASKIMDKKFVILSGAAALGLGLAACYYGPSILSSLASVSADAPINATGQLISGNAPSILENQLSVIYPPAYPLTEVSALPTIAYSVYQQAVKSAHAPLKEAARLLTGASSPINTIIDSSTAVSTVVLKKAFSSSAITEVSALPTNATSIAYSVYQQAVRNAHAPLKLLADFSPPLNTIINSSTAASTVVLKKAFSSSAASTEALTKAFFSSADYVRGVAILAIAAMSCVSLPPSLKNPSALASNARESKKPTKVAFMGVIGGALVGTITNIRTNSGSFMEKSSSICPYFKLPVISTINAFSQTIIKKGGALLNIAPGVLVLGSSIAGRFSAKTEKERTEKNGLIKQSTVNLVNTVCITAIVMGAKTLLKMHQNNFDPSGHMMMNLAGLHGLITAIETTDDKSVTGKIFKTIAPISMIVYGIFSANTAGCFHTPLDIVAGTVCAVAAIQLGSKMGKPIVNTVINASNFAFNGVKRIRDLVKR